MAARLRRVSAKNNSPDVALFRRCFVAVACHTQSMAARLRRVSAKNNSPDVVLFHRYFVAAACHTQSMAARLRRVSAKNNSPDVVLFRRCFVAAACYTQSMAARLRRVSAKNKSPDVVLFRRCFAVIPSPPPAAWRCVRGGCAPVPLRRIRWASGSPASASASCRIRTPGTPAGRCSRWPAPARSS